jgi:prepilin-type N-terminal cleavage/methylation domain-containing protein
MTVFQKGFTLIELAMVLLIIALILGGVLAPLSTKLELDKRKKTADLLEEARSNLVGYALVNGHLPCPDCPDNSVGNCGAVEAGLGAGAINDGIEDAIDDLGSPTNDRASDTFDHCATEEGNLPWVTLDVDELDAWGNHFAYRVSDEFADDYDGTTGCSLATANVSFCIDSTGDIDVDDAVGGNSVAQNMPALIISYGKNADDIGNPSSTSETANQDATSSTFIQKEYTAGGGSDEFDDLLIWVPASTLVYRMVQAERLP